MASKLTLANVKLVLTGDLGGLDPEDVKWDLIARGASVMSSVTKTTGALIATAGSKEKLVQKAKQHGVPILDLPGLKALLEGASVAEALGGASSSSGSSAALAGRRLAISGAFAGYTQSSLASALEGLGAKVVKKASRKLDLVVVGDDPSFAVIDAVDSGVPFLRRPAVDALLGGAALSDFVAERGPEVDDPETYAREALEQLRAELTAEPLGERWEEELTLTLRSAHVIAELRDLGGTPVHDAVREVIQRHPWPRVTSDVTITMPIVFE